MFPSILSRAVKDKVGNSKVIQAFKDTYDYIIGMYLSASKFTAFSDVYFRCFLTDFNEAFGTYC